MSKYVLLETLKGDEWDENYRVRFISMVLGNDDPTKLYDGTLAYRILGYATTIEEAQIKLYGKAYNHESEFRTQR